MTPAQTVEAMAEKAYELAAKFREPASAEMVRAMLNEARILAARHALEDGLERLGKYQGIKRDADKSEREAKDALERATVDADWSLEVPATNAAGDKLLADDRKAWKRSHLGVGGVDEVGAAAAALRSAEHETAVARDGLILADKRLSACRADLDAAICTLNALVMALPARREAS